MALIAGTGLAVSGAVMQAVLRNPLASSYTLGGSSGTGFGASLAIGLGMGIWGGKYIVVANAFIFGMTNIILVYSLAGIKGVDPARVRRVVLLLAALITFGIVAFIDEGRIVALDTPQNLKSDIGNWSVDKFEADEMQTLYFKTQQEAKNYAAEHKNGFALRRVNL